MRSNELASDPEIVLFLIKYFACRLFYMLPNRKKKNPDDESNMAPIIDLTHYQTTNLDFSKPKEFSDDNFKFYEN